MIRPDLERAGPTAVFQAVGGDLVRRQHQLGHPLLAEAETRRAGCDEPPQIGEIASRAEGPAFRRSWSRRQRLVERGGDVLQTPERRAHLMLAMPFEVRVVAFSFADYALVQRVDVVRTEEP